MIHFETHEYTMKIADAIFIAKRVYTILLFPVLPKKLDYPPNLPIIPSVNAMTSSATVSTMPSTIM